MWRQRLRWLKGGHLFLISKDSIFFKWQPHMTLFSKSLYFICPVAHVVQFWTEPIFFTLPFVCIVLNTCPYGMDTHLFITHIVFFFTMHLTSIIYDRWDIVFSAIRAKSGYRILWFTSVKACINTIMVVTGWKAKGHFKFTPKAGLAGDDKGMVDDTVVLGSAESPKSDSAKTDSKAVESLPTLTTSDGSKRASKPVKKAPSVNMHRAHAMLSKVTETRKWCMPLDGTLDIWVLMAVMLLALFSAAVGLRRLIYRDALLKWNDSDDTLIWIGVVFALVDATPGMLFAGCVFLFAMSLFAAVPCCFPLSYVAFARVLCC
jgi:hypothetical protein